MLEPDASEPDPSKKIIWCAVGAGLDGVWGTNDDVTFQHGFVPAATLGIGGSRNNDQLLVDAWNNPIRYSVSAVDRDPTAPTDATKHNNRWDFLAAVEIRAVGMENLFPDLNICSVAGGAGANVCINRASTVVGDYYDPVAPATAGMKGVPAAVFSLGPNGRTFTDETPAHLDELENAGERSAPPYETLGGGPAGDNYLVPADRVFVARTRAGDYDDIVEWISPMVLYSRMISAGQLP